MNRITLTGAQIAELAQFAGIPIDKTDLDEDITDSEYTIEAGPVGVKNDDDTETFFSHFVYCNECAEEGGIGLGDPVEAPKSMVA